MFVGTGLSMHQFIKTRTEIFRRHLLIFCSWTGSYGSGHTLCYLHDLNFKVVKIIVLTPLCNKSNNKVNHSHRKCLIIHITLIDFLDTYIIYKLRQSVKIMNDKISYL